MEITWLCYALNAITMPTLFGRIIEIVNLVRSGMFSNVQESSANGTMISSQNVSTMTLLKIKRESVTIDGIFGTIEVDGNLVCKSGENLNRAIPEGLYDAQIDESPRLGYNCPHIRVPLRDEAAGGDAGIRIHIANEPCQLEGCIETGTQLDGDAVDNSRLAFEKLISFLPPPGVPFKVLVYSIH
jgi:hypothetical protein